MENFCGIDHIFIELKLAKSYKSSITIDLYSLDKF